MAAFTGDGARSDDPAVQRQLDRLTLPVPGETLGLERIAALLDRLGRPHDALPPVLHVAGTNGKGSTCAFLRAGLEATGLRAHVFTSPHLVRFNERIRIAGRLIEDGQLAALLGEVLDTSVGLAPSFFEVATAVAFLAFARTPADACVIEVGLGGRLDATNVVEAPLATGIASIGIDHQAWLGATLAGIAREKAGIAKPGVPLVTLAQAEDAQSAIEAVAGERGAPLWLEARDWTIDPTLIPALPGSHQVRNANLAWQMLRASRLPVTLAQFRDGLAAATWPARLERLADGPLARGRDILVDGAHNEDAARALAAHLAQDPRHLVLGILANKDAAAIVETLRPYALSLSFIPVPDHASHDSAELARQFGGRAAGDVEQAIASLDGPILIAGSLYLAGDALRRNRQFPD